MSFASNLPGGRIMSGRAQAMKFNRKKEEEDNWDFLDDENADQEHTTVAAKNAWNPYDDDGFELTDPAEFKTRHFLKKYLLNSERINN